MQGILIQGYRVASGLAKNCPWPGGSVARQLPIMAQFGVPVHNLFSGTLNIELDCECVPYPDDAEYDFEIDWRAPDKPTHFRLHRLSVLFNGHTYQGWSYRKIYPADYASLHPHPLNVIEILAPKIPGIEYGHSVQVLFD